MFNREQAHTYWKNKEYVPLINLCNEFINQFPNLNNVDLLDVIFAYYFRAGAYHGQGNMQNAGTDCDYIIFSICSKSLAEIALSCSNFKSAQPIIASTYYLRSLIWLSKNDPKQAIADLEMALKFNPGWIDYLLALASLQQKQDIKTALKTLEQVFNYDQLSTKALIMRADIFADKSLLNASSEIQALISSSKIEDNRRIDTLLENAQNISRTSYDFDPVVAILKDVTKIKFPEEFIKKKLTQISPIIEKVKENLQKVQKEIKVRLERWEEQKNQNLANFNSIKNHEADKKQLKNYEEHYKTLEQLQKNIKERQAKVNNQNLSSNPSIAITSTNSNSGATNRYAHFGTTTPSGNTLETEALTITGAYTPTSLEMLANLSGIKVKEENLKRTREEFEEEGENPNQNTSQPGK